MNVEIAKSAGFCFGVSRAVNLVYEQTEHAEGPVYTIGPIIHNEQVVDDLYRKGVRILDEDLLTEDGLSPEASSTVIIRSHGVTKAVYEKLVSSGCRIVDATCPFVQKIHDIVRKESSCGHPIVIIGNPAHPEVLGIRGWTVGPCAVVSNEEDAERLTLPKDRQVCIVSQTTFNFRKFQELVEIVENLGYSVVVTNTICNATKERQRDSMELAERSDMMIVIGGKNSSNTQKLFDICKSRCSECYYIQTAEDLEGIFFDSTKKIGITAGASTPNSIIQEVSQHVRRAEL